MVAESDGRRVFLEVRELPPLVADLESGRGLFVPTRLPLPLNSLFSLAVRLRGVSRSVELPMIIVGRRVPRGGSILSGGVIAKLADPDCAMYELLREVAAGRVVDLEARIQEQQRLPARARFTSTAEAVIELRALLEGAAIFPIDRLVARGDRLALTVHTDDRIVSTPHVVVRSVAMHDSRRSAVIELFDDAGRALVERSLTQLDGSNRVGRARA